MTAEAVIVLSLVLVIKAVKYSYLGVLYLFPIVYFTFALNYRYNLKRYNLPEWESYLICRMDKK